MKKIVKILAALLALVFMLGAFVGCANHGKTMIKVGKNEISVNVYLLYLSRMKGELALGGENVTSSNYWASTVSLDGATAEEYYNAGIVAIPYANGQLIGAAVERSIYSVAKACVEANNDSALALAFAQQIVATVEAA